MSFYVDVYNCSSIVPKQLDFIIHGINSLRQKNTGKIVQLLYYS